MAEFLSTVYGELFFDSIMLDFLSYILRGISCLHFTKDFLSTFYGGFLVYLFMFGLLFIFNQRFLVCIV